MPSSSVSPPSTRSGYQAGTSSSAFPAETIESASGTQSVSPEARRVRVGHLGDDRGRPDAGRLAGADGQHHVGVRVAAGVGRHDGAVGAEADRGLGGRRRRPLLVLGRLLVAAHQHHAGEAQTLAVLPVERAHERAPLEDDRRVPERRPVVLAGRDGAVQELGRVDDARQAGVPDRHAVEVLVVERAEVGELNERGDRRQARVGGAELEALDLGRLGLRASAAPAPRRRRASCAAPTTRAPRSRGPRGA